MNTEINDVFLINLEKKEYPFKYLYVHIIDFDDISKYKIPFAFFKVSNKKLTIDEYNKTPFIRVSWENPNKVREILNKEQNEQKKVYIYRSKIITLVDLKEVSNLEFLGNFSIESFPKNELIFYDTKKFDIPYIRDIDKYIYFAYLAVEQEEYYNEKI